MKIFTAILSLYILALTNVQCADVSWDNSIHNSELSGTTDNQHHNESSHCSPFCACDCCVSPTIYPDNTIQFGCYQYTQKYFSNYASAFVSSIFATIWQPPELS